MSEREPEDKKINKYLSPLAVARRHSVVVIFALRVIFPTIYHTNRPSVCTVHVSPRKDASVRVCGRFARVRPVDGDGGRRGRVVVVVVGRVLRRPRRRVERESAREIEVGRRPIPRRRSRNCTYKRRVQYTGTIYSRCRWPSSSSGLYSDESVPF